MKRILFTLAVGSILLFNQGCDNINDIIRVDVPLTFVGRPAVRNTSAPSTQNDCVDLDTIAAYRDNKDKFQFTDATVQSASFSITNYSIANIPALAQCEFDSIEIFLRFEGETREYHIGSYKNVKATDYYRTPQLLDLQNNIDLRSAIQEFKTKPRFCVYERFSNIKGGGANLFVLIDTQISVTFVLKADLAE